MVQDGEALAGGFRVERSFGWGLLLVRDAPFQAIPRIERGVAVTATGSAVAVAVRHAQDVDLGSAAGEFQVSLEVRLGKPTETAVYFDGVIDIPSGRITFGDADHEDPVNVVPGRWRVQVDLEPEDMPEHVNIWISSAS